MFDEIDGLEFLEIEENNSTGFHRKGKVVIPPHTPRPVFPITVLFIDPNTMEVVHRIRITEAGEYDVPEGIGPDDYGMMLTSAAIMSSAYFPPQNGVYEANSMHLINEKQINNMGPITKRVIGGARTADGGTGFEAVRETRKY